MRTRSKSSRLGRFHHSMIVTPLVQVLGILEADERWDIQSPQMLGVIAVTPRLGLLHAPNHPRILKHFVPQQLVVLQLSNPLQQHVIAVALQRVIGQRQCLQAHQRLEHGGMDKKKNNLIFPIPKLSILRHLHGTRSALSGSFGCPSPEWGSRSTDSSTTKCW